MNTGYPQKNDTVTLSHNIRLDYSNSSGDVMSTQFQTLCRKPCSIRLSSWEDMNDYVTEFISVSFFLGYPVRSLSIMLHHLLGWSHQYYYVNALTTTAIWMGVTHYCLDASDHKSRISSERQVWRFILPAFTMLETCLKPCIAPIDARRGLNELYRISNN